MPTFDLRRYLPGRPPQRSGALPLFRFMSPIPPGATAVMSSGEVVGIISVSLTGVAAVWLLSYFVRPFLDWWYRDIDTFESLLPTVEEMQGIRAGQITNRYRPFVHADDEHDYQYEEAHLGVQLARQVDELVTRLRRIRVPMKMSMVSTDRIDETLAVLVGYMKDGDLRTARAHARAMVESP